MSDGEIKVTDKRMFTPEGELREEYRSLEEPKPSQAKPSQAESSPAEFGQAESPAAAPEPVTVPPQAPGETTAAPGQEAAAPAAPEPENPEIERTDPAETQAFMELVAMLAEPAAMFLGDIPLPDGRVTENLEMARMHIDLLEVLTRKTRGNLNMQEKSALEDVLYRLRSRFVEKQG